MLLHQLSCQLCLQPHVWTFWSLSINLKMLKKFHSLVVVLMKPGGLEAHVSQDRESQQSLSFIESGATGWECGCCISWCEKVPDWNSCHLHNFWLAWTLLPFAWEVCHWISWECEASLESVFRGKWRLKEKSVKKIGFASSADHRAVWFSFFSAFSSCTWLLLSWKAMYSSSPETCWNIV